MRPFRHQVQAGRTFRRPAARSRCPEGRSRRVRRSGDAGIDLDEEREQVGAIQARVETAEVIAVC